MMKPAASLAIAFSLCACAASPSYVRTAPTAMPAPTRTAPPPPAITRDRSDILGQNAGSLTRRFGEARIDLSEGDARKLQFASEGCVIDIYLYPPEAGAAPIATHIVARLREGGEEMDRARCIADVEQAARG